MASAVDSRLAYARLSAVATASRLPTANRGSNNSYTTSWDTTQDCLARADVSTERVDTLVTVSTSGIATPSLDARLMEEMPFRRDVQRLPVFGLGCAGGVLGLARAAAMARAAPGSLVLLLVVELCGLTFRNRDVSKSNVIATALFGDGAAAALITCAQEVSAPEIAGWGEHTWPDSLDVMGWRVEEDGLGVLFSRDIPAIVRERYGAALHAFLARRASSAAIWTARCTIPAAPR